jgi:hypothetical protein
MRLGVRAIVRYVALVCTNLTLLPAPSAFAQGLLDDCSHANPTGCVTIDKPALTWDGYTIFPSHRCRSYAIDMTGRLIRTWPICGIPIKMLPGANIMGSLRLPDLQGIRHPRELECLVEMSWNMNGVWPQWLPGSPRCIPRTLFLRPIPWDVDDLGRPITRIHHDFQREGNPVGYYAPGQEAVTGGGRTLVLAHSEPPLGQTPHISGVPLLDDSFYEVAADGTTILWEWHASDYFEQMGFDEPARQAIFAALGRIERHTGRFDWLHINSLSWIGPNRWCPDPDDAEGCDHRFHPDNLIWDSREANILAITARHDHPQGAWQAGDIVWRVGPDYHHAHLIPEGLPGAGNVLVFDNGGFAGYGADANGEPDHPAKTRFYSRVIEFDPIDRQVVWLYQRPNGPGPGENYRFFSPFVSAAQRLVNGNTFITEGKRGRLFEVTSNGGLVWEFVSPFGTEPPGLPGVFNANSVFRAYRVPAFWVPAGGAPPPRP